MQVLHTKMLRTHDHALNIHEISRFDTVVHAMSLRTFFLRLFGRAPGPSAVTEIVVRSAEEDRPSEIVHQQAVPIDGDHLIVQFREQLSTQAQSQAHLNTLLGSLSTTLNALPQLARQQGQVLEVLVADAARARHRDQTIERSLVHLSEGSDRQTQVLGLVQQQLDLNHEVSIRVAESLRETASAITTFATASERQSRALEVLAQSTQRRVAQSDRLEKALQFWLAIVGAICTLALVYAIWAATRGPVIIAIPPAPVAPPIVPPTAPTVVAPPAAPAPEPTAIPVVVPSLPSILPPEPVAGPADVSSVAPAASTTELPVGNSTPPATPAAKPPAAKP